MHLELPAAHRPNTHREKRRTLWRIPPFFPIQTLRALRTLHHHPDQPRENKSWEQQRVGPVVDNPVGLGSLRYLTRPSVHDSKRWEVRVSTRHLFDAPAPKVPPLVCSALGVTPTLNVVSTDLRTARSSYTPSGPLSWPESFEFSALTDYVSALPGEEQRPHPRGPASVQEPIAEPRAIWEVIRELQRGEVDLGAGVRLERTEVRRAARKWEGGTGKQNSRHTLAQPPDSWWQMPLTTTIDHRLQKRP